MRSSSMMQNYTHMGKDVLKINFQKLFFFLFYYYIIVKPLLIIFRYFNFNLFSIIDSIQSCHMVQFYKKFQKTRSPFDLIRRSRPLCFQSFSLSKLHNQSVTWLSFHEGFKEISSPITYLFLFIKKMQSLGICLLIF